MSETNGMHTFDSVLLTWGTTMNQNNIAEPFMSMTQYNKTASAPKNLVYFCESPNLENKQLLWCSFKEDLRKYYTEQLNFL